MSYKEIKFASIDSSLRNTGIAIGTINLDTMELKIEEIDLITTEKSINKSVRASSDTIKRGRATYKFVTEKLKHQSPALIFAETPSGSQNAASFKSYGMTCQLLASLTPEPIEIAPVEAKKLTFGRKSVSKKEIINWAYNKHPNLEWLPGKAIDGKLSNNNEHTADAIMIANSCIKLPEVSRLLGMFRKA